MLGRVWVVTRDSVRLGWEDDAAAAARQLDRTANSLIVTPGFLEGYP